MPIKSWVIDLGESHIVATRFTKNGELVSFTVLLMAWIEERWQCVTRFDCAHGFPHQDVLGRRGGLLYKQTFPGLSVKEVLSFPP